MLANYQRAIPLILATEGPFVNDPQDPGGATNLGVTIGTARQLGIDVNHDGKTDILDIKLLKPADAAKVYKRFYWDTLQADFLPSGLDYAVVDFGINSGVTRSAQFLQRLLGVTADGHIGPQTLTAVSRSRSTKQLITLLSNDRLAYLKRLPKWPRFGGGWEKRVNAVEKVALGWAA